MSDYGRETVVLVEIDQPFCTREYGDAFASPSGGCTALLGSSGERKCYNTRATCQDTANYSPDVLTLRFGRKQQALVRHYGFVVTSIASGPDITPAVINLAAMDKVGSTAALGQREVVSIAFEDHRYSDLKVDKYRLQRLSGAAASGSPSGESFDPYTRGTFWGKWLARNPYNVGYPLRVYWGYLGDAIEDMRVGHYIIDSVDGPNNGLVKITAKDQFSKVEAQKAVAPTASRGELAAGITGSPGSFTVTPATIVEEDYPNEDGSPSQIHVAIGKEIIRCSRSGATFTILQRGALGSTQENHDAQDLVQRVLHIETELSHDIVYDLLVDSTGIDSSLIDKSEWDTLAAEIDTLYSGYIAKPTPVSQLIGELMEQAGFTVWPDIATGMIRYAPFRSSAAQPTVNDSGWIIDGSLTGPKRATEKRASEVWVYYAQINPLEGLEEDSNYRSRVIEDDVDAEDETQYGVPQIRKVFSRWIPQFGRQAAEECGNRILAMFRDPPVSAKFSIHATRDGELDLGQYFELEVAELQDDSGEVEAVVMAPLSMERGENDIEVTATSVRFALADSTTDRTIHIENDTFNIDLRSIYDSLFDAPETGSPSQVITFIVDADVTVGSTSTSSPAMRTGVWTSADRRLVNLGRIQGKGGRGGDGGNPTGVSGETGGDALLVESAFRVDNTDGEIWSGGGGGAGGGVVFFGGAAFTAPGGGGAGTNPGAGGVVIANPANTPATAGTEDAGGVGANAEPVAGIGGNGGAPGLPGTSCSGTGSGSASNGSAGLAGRYVVGNALVTWVAVGDVRGNVA